MNAKVSRPSLVILAAVLVCMLGVFLAVATLSGGPAEASDQLPLSDPTSPDAPFADSPQMAEFAAEHEIPAEVERFTREEMSEVSLEFPPGVSEPTLAELLPYAVDATTVRIDGDLLVLDSTRSNPESDALMSDLGAENEDPGINVVVAKGDLVVLKVVNWQCAWIDEFTRATRLGDAKRVSAAEAQLRTFPSLRPLHDYNPDLLRSYDGVIAPILEGDLELADQWLNSCLPQR